MHRIGCIRLREGKAGDQEEGSSGASRFPQELKREGPVGKRLGSKSHLDL